MLEPAAEGGGLLRAELRIGGRSVARHQLELALAWQCERVVCVAAALSPELVQLQHLAEGRGARFHVITGPRALAGLVSAADEIFVLSDGLFASEPAIAVLEAGQGVVVQPIESGLAAGFERIDLNSASGGAMRVPGRLVAQLAELPPDCDAVAALQRLALQAGVARRQLPTIVEGQFWTLVRADAEAHAIEPRWVRQRLGVMPSWTPGHWLALLSVRRFGAALLDSGSGTWGVLAGALVLVALSLGAGWFGQATLAFGFLGCGWIVKEAYGLLRRIEGRAVTALSASGSLGWLIDGVLVALAGWAVIPHEGQFEPDRYFPAMMLLALLRLVPRALDAKWTALLKDRALLTVLLGGASLAGEASLAVHGAAVLVALAGIVLSRADFRLTRP
jgi:hypothetical protein